MTDYVNAIVVGVCALSAIQGCVVYSVVRLLVTGRPIFERQRDQEPEERGRVVGRIHQP